MSAIATRGTVGPARRWAALIAGIGLLVGFITFTPMSTAAAAVADTNVIFDEAPVSADPLPTAQINGVAWTQVVSSSTVFVGGEFTNARPAGEAAGTSLVPRTNLLSYNLATGVLNSGWAPTTNAAVRAITTSPDGSRVYVGGQFTQVNGVTRYRVAALNSTTGALITTWQPQVNGRVDGLAAKGNVVYIVGQFSDVSGSARARVAAVDATTGAVLPFSAAVDGGYGVKGIVVSPDSSKVVIAGDFTSVNGSTNPGRGLAAMDATSGALMPWAANSVVRDADKNAGMYSISADSDSVYATGWSYGGTAEDGFEGSVRMSWTDGSIVWIEDCHGDTYGVASVAGAIFKVGHSHYCGNIGGFPQTDPWGFHHTLAFSKAPSGNLITPDPYGYKSYTGMQAPRPLNWYPNWTVGTYTGQSQAAWSVTGNDQYVVFGGEFPSVNGSNQQGLARFAIRSIAPNQMGPQTKGGAWPLRATSFVAGQARLAWFANYNLDSSELTYQVIRQDLGVGAPLTTFKQKSTFFSLPALSYTDRGVVAGQTYNYRIQVTDRFGVSTRTDWVPVVISATGQQTTYASTILADAPVSYWPLGESSGTIGYDWAGADDLAIAGATRGSAGQQLNATTTATSFAGNSSSYATDSILATGRQVFTAEAWFKTTSTAGGKILGFGANSSGNSSSYDRHVYLSGAGKVTFGV